MQVKKISVKTLTPVLMAFFVMSFCDLVGIATDRVKQDFGLSNTLAQLLPSAVFLWFLLLAVPVGVWQDRLGKRKVLNMGILLTAAGLFVPLLHYSFPVVLLAFALLGIGNTIVQVAANPLLVDVVPGEQRSSFLSFSQFVKALGSMLAAPLAGWLASRFGDWKLVFLVFGIVSVVTALWLAYIPIEESRQVQQRASVTSSFKLLGNRYISLMVLGIFLLVGVDVGINSVSGQYLLANGTPQALAESGRSFYFFGKMLGTFGGAILLTRFPAKRFLLFSSAFGLLSLIALLPLSSGMPAMVTIFLAGLGLANIFPLIFSLCVERYPDRANEISGLVIMAVTGGAVLPLLTGWTSDLFSLTAGMLLIVVCTVYFIILSFYASGKN